jgi:hypothetical protein
LPVDGCYTPAAALSERKGAVEPTASGAAPAQPDLEARYQAALKLIRESRWTEAKRTLDEVAGLDPTYKQVATLRTMVEEVIQTSFFGVRLPPHLAAYQRSAPPLEPSDEPDEAEEPAPPPSPRTRWPLVLAAIVVVVMVLTIWLLFPR